MTTTNPAPNPNGNGRPPQAQAVKWVEASVPEHVHTTLNLFAKEDQARAKVIVPKHWETLRLAGIAISIDASMSRLQKAMWTRSPDEMAEFYKTLARIRGEAIPLLSTLANKLDELVGITRAKSKGTRGPSARPQCGGGGGGGGGAPSSRSAAAAPKSTPPPMDAAVAGHAACAEMKDEPEEEPPPSSPPPSSPAV